MDDVDGQSLRPLLEPNYPMGRSDSSRLDIRYLLHDYRREVEQGRSASWVPVLHSIRSVQFISTPHRGTNLAHHLGQSWLLSQMFQVLLRVGYEGTRGLWEWGTSAYGRLLPSSTSPDWIDAIVDTMVGFHVKRGLLRHAQARASYFETLRWVLDMSSDVGVVSDLAPEPPPGVPESPAHWDDKRVPRVLAVRPVQLGLGLLRRGLPGALEEAKVLSFAPSKVSTATGG